MTHSTNDIWRLLSEIPDPEIPVLNIVELGIIRSVTLESDVFSISVTPTYTGCPASEFIDKEIKSKLLHARIAFDLKKQISPSWTTDWITDEGRKKLQDYGIAPPEQSSADKSLLTGDPKQVTCPQCKSRNTEVISEFGSTPCKSLFRCHDCLEAFDYFKCI